MKTILLIEDDPALLRLAQTILRDAGYTSDAAADGDQARTKLQATPYHGIVLDLTVPGGDGYSLAEQISGLDANRHTPLIIVGSDEPRGRQRAFDAGAMAYLPKPVTAEAFRTVLHSVINPEGARPSAVPRVVPPWPSVTAMPPAPTPSRSPAVDDPSADDDFEGIASGSIAVSFQDGPVYWCAPSREGGWRCARCEMGLIRSDAVGTTCGVCHAAVMRLPSRLGSVGWLILFIIVGLALGWALLNWWN